jgi:hypothetical protein
MHAQHSVLAFIDADDEYMPGALAAPAAFLTEHPRQPSTSGWTSSTAISPPRSPLTPISEAMRQR